MSRYRKVEVKTWMDEKFRHLTPMPASGQGLWLFLMTGPHTGPIPGLFRAGRAGMAEELGWKLEAFDEAFGEVFAQGMAKADFKARLVWLPNALKHNKPESPNVVRSWRVDLDLLPECALKIEAVAHIRDHLESVGKAFVEAFDDVLGKRKEASPKPSVKPFANPMPNQEQEQEQDQQQQQEEAKALGAEAPDKSESVAGVVGGETERPLGMVKPKAPPAGARLPDGWTLPQPWADWARSERSDMTELDIRREAACFADYWHGKAGADARKADWEATWRNWIRRAVVSGNGLRAPPPGPRKPIHSGFEHIDYGKGGML